MKREIKFRAWDIPAKKYRGVDGLKDLFSIRSDGFFNEDYVLEQFTGLKDKNGKEIYEGDILSKGKISKRPSWKKGHDYYCVSFSNGVFVANGYNGEFKVSPILHNLNSGCEIIGNIHENPELLNN